MWVIDSIWPDVLGTTTVYNVNVQTSGGTSIGRIGGQVGAGTNPNQAVLGPCVCAASDAPNIIITATGATFVSLTIHAHLESA